MIGKYALFKVVRFVIRETQELSLREIAKKAKVGTGTAKLCLDYLEKNNILTRKIVGKTHLFKTKEHFLSRQLKITFSLAEISSSRLVEDILAKNTDILSICLYGSVAKGLDDKNSDIDIFIISRKKIEYPSLSSQKKLNREVNLIKYTYQEWKEKAEKDPVFYKEVILSCIPLYGEKPVVT